LKSGLLTPELTETSNPYVQVKFQSRGIKREILALIIDGECAAGLANCGSSFGTGGGRETGKINRLYNFFPYAVCYQLSVTLATYVPPLTDYLQNSRFD
jgi:hypothetical protein